MNATPSTVLVSESIGQVSTLALKPNNPKAIIVLAHGAGAGMKHRFMENLAGKLADLSVATVRYNFPYIEKGGKRPDVPAVAEKTVEVVLADAQMQSSETPIFLAGKSFGGRMSSQFLSKKQPNGLKGIIFFGFPLHPPGKTDVQRAEHLSSVKVPMLFLQGTRDALATIEMMENVCARLNRSTLIKFQGADHSFKVKGKELIDDLAVHTSRWIDENL